MKFGQLIWHNKKNIFLLKSCKKWGRETSSRRIFVFFFKKLYIRQYISIALNLECNKNKLCKTLYYWSRDMLHLDFFEKGLGKVSPPHVQYSFSRKIFLMVYSINWLNFIVWLPLFPELPSNACIAIVCFLVCDVINFEIKILKSFSSSCFSAWPQIHDKNLNILGTKRAFKVK